MHKNHMKHMVIGCAVILAALLLVGLPFGTALPWAFLLACPLMMGAMMIMMMRGSPRPDAPKEPTDEAPTEQPAQERALPASSLSQQGLL